MVLHVMDQDELTFPFQGNTMFRGLEDTGRVTVEPRALRQGYLDVVNRFCTEVKRKCVANHIDYKLVSTADRLDAALMAFLGARAAATRKSSAKK
jgi:putative hemolysin